jgi:hypothetical protein
MVNMKTLLLFVMSGFLFTVAGVLSGCATGPQTSASNGVFIAEKQKTSAWHWVWNSLQLSAYNSFEDQQEAGR